MVRFMLTSHRRPSKRTFSVDTPQWLIVRGLLNTYLLRATRFHSMCIDAYSGITHWSKADLDLYNLSFLDVFNLRDINHARRVQVPPGNYFDPRPQPLKTLLKFYMADRFPVSVGSTVSPLWRRRSSNQVYSRSPTLCPFSPSRHRQCM